MDRVRDRILARPGNVGRSRAARSAARAKPAAARMASIRAGSAKAKGPIAGSGAPSACGAKRSKTGRCATIQSFSARARKQEKSSRPPGTVSARRWVKAATGSSKNITPWRETISSKRPEADGHVAASPVSKRSPGRPSARSRAAAIRASDRSRPVIAAPGIASARARLVAPAPQPMSRMCFGAERHGARRPEPSFSGARVRSVRRHSSAQASPTRPCHSMVSVMAFPSPAPARIGTCPGGRLWAERPTFSEAKIRCLRPSPSACPESASSSC